MIKYVKEYWMFVGIVLLVVLFVGMSFLHPHKKSSQTTTAPTEKVMKDKGASSEELPAETENEKKLSTGFSCFRETLRKCSFI